MSRKKIKQRNNANSFKMLAANPIDTSERFEGGWAVRTVSEGIGKILIGIECRKDGIKDIGEPLGEDWYWAKQGSLSFPVDGKSAAVGAYWMRQLSRYYREITNDPILQDPHKRFYARAGQVFFENQKITEIRINCLDESGLEYNLWAPDGPPIVFNNKDSDTEELQIAGAIRPNLTLQEESDGYLHPSLRVTDRGRCHFSFCIYTPPDKHLGGYILALWDLQDNFNHAVIIQQLQQENSELRSRLAETAAAHPTTMEMLDILKRLDPSSRQQAERIPLDWEQISTQIRIAREKRSWSQEALAETAGIDRKSVNAIENGRSVSGNTLFAVLNALNGNFIIE